MCVLKPTGERTSKPTQKTVLGSFMESGFGCQNSRMWSEMISNRSFAEYEPLKGPTWGWLGLDREHYNENAPFWHSGYEEYDWETMGKTALRHCLGARTYKGHFSLLVDNPVDAEGGIKQKGIHLEKGRAYRFLIFAGLYASLTRAGLNGFGDDVRDGGKSSMTVFIGKNAKVFEIETVSKEYSWEFTAAETEVSDIRVTFAKKQVLVLSYVSLMPADNVDGWRREVIDCMKEAAPTVVRFPGGCFASFYDWQATVGNRNEREAQTSYYWGGLEENDVGLDEFMRLSELVGFEPQICFNMMTSSPFKARQLVEYLNGDSSRGMGYYRKLNGHAEPYGARLFEMDNEPGRKWTARQYAEQCVLFAKEMKQADPDIELLFAAYAYPPEALPMMLDIVGKEIKYVIYRQGDPAFCQSILPVIRAFNEQNGTDLRLVNTEWLASCESPEPFEIEGVPMNFEWRSEITNDYRTVFSIQQRCWNYAMNGAHRILDYISYGGDFALANFNNMCNTWGQNLLEASKDAVWLSCMGEIFAFFHRNFAPCTAQGVETGEPLLFALKTFEEGRKKMYLINHGAAEREADFGESGWRCIETLAGESRIGGNTADHSVVTHTFAKVDGTKARLAGLSVSVFQRESK